MNRFVTRRGLFATLAAGGLAFWSRGLRAAGGVKKVAFALSKVEALAKVGGFAVLKIKGRDVLLVRDGDKSVRALDPTCSHQKCTVAYEPKDGLLHCPCHKSAYNLDGKVLDGPAPKPLTIFAATLDGDRVILSLPEA
ncbi:MAG: Rieske (2Fe-2S) protein [Deltaproteobacteria bacterium]|nr:Rieske (2Fe-2S) protein [Deltaproteobacteria bacterium]